MEDVVKSGGKQKSSQKIIIPIFCFYKAGGFRVLSKLASEFYKKGIEVKFVSYHNSDKPYFPTLAEVVWIDESGLPITERGEPSVSRKKDILKGFVALARYLRNNTGKEDIIISNFFLTAWPTLFSPSHRKFYYIQAYEPGMLASNSMVTFLLKGLAWLSYFLPYKRVVNAGLYLKYKNIKSEDVVPPGIDLDVFYPKKSGDKILKEKVIVGCIGRMAEWKGANDVARAVTVLRNKGVNVEFRVAFHEVKMDKDQYDLVIPDGDENLAEFYRGLDVLIAPGHIQLGAVHYPVVEAMACNVSVITTGYYPARDGNSYIVPIKSPDEIANKVLEIIAQPDDARCKRVKALQDIQAMSWPVVAQKFIDILNADNVPK